MLSDEQSYLEVLFIAGVKAKAVITWNYSDVNTDYVLIAGVIGSLCLWIYGVFAVSTFQCRSNCISAAGHCYIKC